jgi:DNA replication protein DnaC
VDPHSWLYLHGPVGRGKTGLAVGWARKLIWDGSVASALFIKVPRLLNDIRASYGRDKSNEDVLKPSIETDLLILDDLGSINASNIDWLTEVMYLILDSRHDNHRTTIITCNRTLIEVGELIGFQNAWRIQEMCGDNGIIELNGANLRDK